MNYIYGNFVI